MSLLSPKISCICVTQNRHSLLRKAINCFIQQDYPNKELVISYTDDDENTKSLVWEILLNPDIEINPIQRTIQETLGSARNEAIAKCTGEYVCIWDDDDWYHPNRLSFQLSCLFDLGKGFQASILMYVLLYDSTTENSYVSFPYTWEGTILCKKEILIENQYRNSTKAEDTQLIKYLDTHQFLYHIEDAPHLYIYNFHGGNTWEYTHYKHFVDKSVLLDKETREIIRGAIKQ